MIKRMKTGHVQWSLNNYSAIRLAARRLKSRAPGSEARLRGLDEAIPDHFLKNHQSREAVRADRDWGDWRIVAVVEPGERAEHPLVQDFILLHLVFQVDDEGRRLVAESTPVRRGPLQAGQTLRVGSNPFKEAHTQVQRHTDATPELR